MNQITSKPHTESTQQPPTETEQTAQTEQSGGRKKAWLVVFFLFVIIIALLGLGGYQGWQFFRQYEQHTEAKLEALQAQLAERPLATQLEAKLNPLNRKIDQTSRQLPALEQGQQDLTRSVEKLFALYARDKNGWKLSEVEYLMSVAQHKLILEYDFEGAARTLNAASERIAELADPGLLPVRVKINDEITQLKTRKRPDLVGMTLLLSRLARQVGSLRPGYQPRMEEAPVVVPVQETRLETNTDTAAEKKAETKTEMLKSSLRELDEKLIKFMGSLVTVKTAQPARPETVEKVTIPDVREKLQETLKLTRWAVLDRDALQFSKLMEQNVYLFKQNYDLEKPANADFLNSLYELQQSSIQPELPDITQSLRLLKEIQTKRETPLPQSKQEANNG